MNAVEANCKQTVHNVVCNMKTKLRPFWVK